MTANHHPTMTIDLINPAHLLVTAAAFLFFSVMSNYWGQIMDENKDCESSVAVPTILSWLAAACVILVSVCKLVAQNW